jgi:hypothetical protein
MSDVVALKEAIVTAEGRLTKFATMTEMFRTLEKWEKVMKSHKAGFLKALAQYETVVQIVKKTLKDQEENV